MGRIRSTTNRLEQVSYFDFCGSKGGSHCFPAEQPLCSELWDAIPPTRPILFAPNSVNHSEPSFPLVMPVGRLSALGVGNSSVTTPVVVIRPILLALNSVNHSAPSGPTVMPLGPLSAVGMSNSVIAPVVVIRPILPVRSSTNHSAPSGPRVITVG